MTDSTNPDFDPTQCTLDTCSLDYANFDYVPSLAGNVTYVALFGILLIAHLFFGIRYKTWGFLIGMFGGLLLEVVGYAGRIQLHYNPFPFDPFLQQLICLTLAPAFMSASVYLCLARIVMVYGPETSRLKPRVYTYIFVSFDLISLILQGGGGGITATADDKKTGDMGVNIMMAGLIFQVLSLLAFMVICVEYGFRIRRHRELQDPSFADLRSSFMFRAFLFALATATVLIFIRCVYRVAELKDGFDGHLANDELTFMIFEGPMIIAACAALAFFHPGLCFGGRWTQAKPAVNKTKGEKGTYAMVDLSSEDTSYYSSGGEQPQPQPYYSPQPQQQQYYGQQQ